MGDARTMGAPHWDHDEPIAIVGPKVMRIHRRVVDEEWFANPKIVAAWMRGLVEIGRAKRARSRQRAYVRPADWAAVLDRYGHRCVYCGRSDVPLERDHRVAVTRGGSDSLDNLVPACKPCNVRKSNHDPAGWPMLGES